jgi:site-specific recombinase
MGDERGVSLYERLPLDSKEKALKFLIYGLLTAIIFGTILMISKTIAGNASIWQALDNQQNEMNYMQGVYGYNDYIERLEKTALIAYWMQYQVVIFGNIARIGVNIGLIFIMIAFVSFALNDKLDERFRRISLTLAGVILFVVMFTTFFSNISIDVS